MKIAILNNLYYPFNRGGAESVIREMVSNFKRNGHEVFLITTKPGNEKTPENNEDKIYYLNSAYYDLAKKTLVSKLLWQALNLFSSNQVNKIKTILKTEKPDLIMTHNLMGLSFKTPLLIKKLGIKHEHYLHDIQLLHPSGLMIFGKERILNNIFSKSYQFFTRRFFNAIEKVVSPSRWLANLHLEKGFFRKENISVKPLVDKITVAENYLDEALREKNCFLFVGQIESHKGIILLIEAFKKALTANPEISLIIIGDGRLLENAKKMAQDFSQIKFLGRLNSEEVAREMKKSAYLIIPSLCYENSPMTIYEAHNNNLPIIAANIGGIPEALKETDILFKPGDENDLTQKILSKLK